MIGYRFANIVMFRGLKFGVRGFLGLFSMNGSLSQRAKVKTRNRDVFNFMVLNFNF
jgi:hypothetical protein